MAYLLGTMTAMLLSPAGLISAIIIIVSGGAKRRLIAAGICGVIAGIWGYSNAVRVAKELGIPDPSLGRDVGLYVFTMLVFAGIVIGISALFRKSKPAGTI